MNYYGNNKHLYYCNSRGSPLGQNRKIREKHNNYLIKNIKKLWGMPCQGTRLFAIKFNTQF